MNHIAVKTLLVLLLLIFVFWGISGILYSNHGEDAYGEDALKVGNTRYSPAEFAVEREKQIKTILYQTGRERLDSSEEQAALYRDATIRVIENALLLEESRRLGLLISNDMVKYYITKLPTFQKDNKFDKELLQSILKSNNLSEEQFIENFRNEIAQEQLILAFLANSTISPILVEQCLDALLSKRKIELFKIKKSTFKPTNKPTEEELKQILADNREDFSTPEVREINYFLITIDDVPGTFTVSEDELKAQYEIHLLLFKEPEKRQVMQLIFPALQEAEQAYAKLSVEQNNEEGWKQAVENLKMPKEAADLGWVTYEGLDSAVAQEIFSLSENAVSKPIQTPIGWHIFKVRKIMAERIKPFEEVSTILKKQVILQKRFDKLQEIERELKEELASNQISLEEAAARYQLKVQKRDISKHDKDDGVISTSFVEEVFKLQNLSGPAVFHTNDNSFVFYQVLKTIPSTLLDFRSIRAQLESIWIKEKTDQKASQVASELKAAIENGTYKDAKDPTIEKSLLTISVNDGFSKLPAPLAAAVFKLGVGEVTGPSDEKDDCLAIVKLTAIEKPEAADLSSRAQSEQLLLEFQKESRFLEYLEYLKNYYGVQALKINGQEAR